MDFFRKFSIRKSNSINSATFTVPKESSTFDSSSSEIPNYDGPPIHFVLFGAGDRARILLSDIFKFCEFGSVVVADESEAAVNFTIPQFRSQLRFKQTESSIKTLKGIVLRSDQDYEDALKIPVDSTGKEIDVNKWCMIASRNANHKKDCLFAISKGYHIFCEKPLALTIPDCTAILESYQTSRNLYSPPLRFVTGFVLRHAAMYQHIHTLVSKNFVGKIISCEFNELLGLEHGSYIFRNWRRKISEGGPNILEKCCHDLDIIIWLINSVPGGGNWWPSRVAAFGGTNIFVKENLDAAENIRSEFEKVSGPISASRLFRNWASYTESASLDNPFTSGGDIEDNLVSIIEFDSGVRISFHLNCFSAIKQRRLLICGIEGTIEADLKTGQIRANRISGKDIPEESDKSFKSTNHGGGDYFLVVDWFKQIVGTGNEQSGSNSAENSSASDLGGTIKDMYVSAVTALAIEEARRNTRIVDLETEHWEVVKQFK
ncbi:hypothetical protein HK098_000386 [Nowakowskiella sp. JEL0407]|nr:hypothetical protein HK098_000386 [Nowakowskiella sp. JEL0407]